jgi:toxin ParE1/3/4
MSLPVVLSPLAQRDFDRAYTWYEDQREGLGAEFEAAIREAMERLSRLADSHSPIYKRVRRTLVQRFDRYALLYTIEPDCIGVISVFHTSRNPAVWKARYDEEHGSE